ncbi:uncharacterized protein LOC127848291 [Dreissena polymorpha]|nr:uncharacterized protein LOC127848291 [Dreissena polymorpha]
MFIVVSCGMHVARSQEELVMILAKEVGMTFVKDAVHFVSSKIFPKLASLIGIPVEEDTAALIKSATKTMEQNLENIRQDLKADVVLSENMAFLQTYSASIMSTMENIRRYIAYPDQQQDSKENFMDDYKADNMRTKTRDLPRLLTNDIIGRPNLISLVLDTNHCNITRATSFFEYCARLVSYGVLAEIQYTRFQNNNSESELSLVIDFWKPKDDQINNAFISAIDGCKQKWASVAIDDLKTAPNADALWAVNNKWVPWLYNDVIFSSGRRSFRFAYSSTELRSVVKDNLRYSVFYNNKTVEYETSDVLTEKKFFFRDAIDSKVDVEAAKHVSDAVEAYLTDRGYAHENIIVLFDEGGQVTEHISQGSPLLAFTLEKIQLDDYAPGFEGGQRLVK